MLFDTLPVPPLEANCCLLGDEKSGLAALVDPGGAPEQIQAMLRASGLTLSMILLTHGHYDHVGAVPALRQVYPDVPVYIHEKELRPEGTPTPQYYLPHQGAAQRTYGDGDVLDLGGTAVRVLHTPGHSAGSVVLLAEDVMLSGDTLFAGGCGRWDLPGGDGRAILSSLARLGALEGDFRICPGHGPMTTLHYERQYNPYLIRAMKP